ncbi:MAG: alpha/beta hydrolase [Spirulinaceae cyanobacterium RM2_2_10]|nr:alpha/beta hydrolase [Spirulinaceae cyanobacterium SM2_1_0]NJO19851.1 alpha/beta hydrolase [Spirulinaceae cyanobacterium RM2_2_10]
MIEPLGAEQRLLATALGQMVYYTLTGAPWRDLYQQPWAELPPLVFLHGFGGGSSAYEWSQVYPAFALDYRVLAPDLPGWGRSDHPERDYQPEDYLTSIATFLEQVSEPPTTVIASSLTAALTIRLAVARPDLFRSLILVAPAGVSDFGDDFSQTGLAQIARTPIINGLFYSLGIATTGGINRFLEERQFARSERIYPELVQAYQQSATQPHADAAALSFVSGRLCFDLANYIGQLTVPTVILWGEEAKLTPLDLGKRLAALNPGAIRWFQAIAGVGLTPQLEAPSVTIALIRHALQVLGVA